MNHLTLEDLDPHWAVGDQPRWRVGQPMTLPVGQVYLHHTVTVPTGDPKADACAVNDIDMHRFGKISYSWQAHLASRTWIDGETTHRGAHTINNAKDSLNGISFGVAVIGNFQQNVPGVPTSPALTPEDEQFIADGLRTFVVPHLTAGWRLDPHSHVYATACCGDLLRPRVPIIRGLVDQPAHQEEDNVKYVYVRPHPGAANFAAHHGLPPIQVHKFKDTEYLIRLQGDDVIQAAGGVPTGDDLDPKKSETRNVLVLGSDEARSFFGV